MKTLEISDTSGVEGFTQLGGIIIVGSLKTEKLFARAQHLPLILLVIGYCLVIGNWDLEIAAFAYGECCVGAKRFRRG
jgi:hypothetical protein